MKRKTLLGVLALLIAGGMALGGWMRHRSRLAPTDVYNATQNTGLSQPSMQQQAAQLASGDASLDETTTGGEDKDTQTFSLVQNSSMGWKATKPTGAHTGTITLTDGFIAVRGEDIVGGQFRIDMNTIRLLDIDNTKLEKEIREDFFEAPKFPMSQFTITSVKQAGGKYVVAGDLTIKDKTVAIEFPADIVVTADAVTAKAKLSIDRKKWGLTMWDGKVNDYLEYDMNLVFGKAL